ncbi:alpha/beta fold hydrolase [Streptomyces sp. NPDC059679]|uniref:alpha/beta fold hydrolase n=1 Tax=Streptomyces sp. NPDC059679 TaxID=3346903 RepID=UPI0036A658F3
MSILDVPGAKLSYEMRGSGPLMLMIPGAGGDGGVFAMVAEHLAAHYSVITYDRRGFSRSRLDGPQDYDRRLAADADDVRRLIEHLSDGPAIIVGTSSGGLVALEVLARHPDVVRTLIPYEPPAMRALPGGQKWIDFFHSVYDLYRASGIQPALEKFREQAFTEADRRTMARAAQARTSESLHANAVYWFEHELRQYPAASLDIEALTVHADRILLASGRESRGYPCYEVNVALGNRLGRTVVEMPGGHVGFVAHPAEFAHALTQALGRNRPRSDAATRR